MIKSGGHATLSINYKDLGKHAGLMAGDILLKNKTVKEIGNPFLVTQIKTYFETGERLMNPGDKTFT